MRDVENLTKEPQMRRPTAEEGLLKVGYEALLQTTHGPHVVLEEIWDLLEGAVQVVDCPPQSLPTDAGDLHGPVRALAEAERSLGTPEADRPAHRAESRARRLLPALGALVGVVSAIVSSIAGLSQGNAVLI